MIEPPSLPGGAKWREWGIDPAWSNVIDVPSHDGSSHRWHMLDTGRPETDEPWATIVCVHGNPTWAYAWKSFLTRFAERHRVIALDQLGMGFSDRVSHRGYAHRVADLGDVMRSLDLDAETPLVLAAHDWGGAIAMGWAVDHTDDVDGMVLCNTGIGVPEGRGAPKIIRLAASAPLRDLVCRRTSGFVEGTVRLSGDRIDAIDRQAFRAPYREARHRQAIADFVGDVPLRDGHPSAPALERVSNKLGGLDAPVLLAWGARDIVFDDDFANDLAGRIPNTEIQRFGEANHLVMAEADVATTVDTWLTDLLSAGQLDGAAASADLSLVGSSVFDGVERRRSDGAVAVHDAATGTSITFADFARRVDGVAAALRHRGLEAGDRVAMLTPPGVDLLVAVYGVWRAGGVTVIADRGLGLRGLGAAVASTRPNWTLGPRAARMASGAMRWAPGATHIDTAALMSEAADPPVTELPAPPTPGDDVAILFTSGATGPAKGVRYRHGQLAAQRDALAATYAITDDDRLVAAFAPFALYGPALGVPTAFTDCDVTTPGELTADAFDLACAAIDATMAFASPAALANVVATATDGDDRAGLAALRLVFSAGAPVPSEILHKVRDLTPRAELHTPYGMTEALPVADIDLDGIDAAEASDQDAGVCVGVPVAGAEVMIAPLDFDALHGIPPAVSTGGFGEILVRAPWVSDGYLGRWETQRLARPGGGWHRTGDVGRLDEIGRLWVDGRAVHVIRSDDGPIASVPLERALERQLCPQNLVTAGRVAAVGIGPHDCQQVVIVVERRGGKAGLADEVLAAAVRGALEVPVAAVLITGSMPVDIRHNTKIDRLKLATWASEELAGERARRPRRRR